MSWLDRRLSNGLRNALAFQKNFSESRQHGAQVPCAGGTSRHQVPGRRAGPPLQARRGTTTSRVRRMRVGGLALSLSAMVDSLGDLPQLGVGSSRLFLCRHGETDSNAQSLLQGSGIDCPLNDVGRAQASALARSLASIKMDVIASSTLSRAVATADIVASHQADRETGGAPERQRYAGLVEMFYGRLEGLPIRDTRDELKRLSDAWAAGDTTVAVGGDGESPDALLQRARETLWSGGLLGCAQAGRQVAVVAHSTLNRAVLADATGQPLGAMFSIPQDNACVNVLDLEVATGRVSVVALNITPLAE